MRQTATLPTRRLGPGAPDVAAIGFGAMPLSLEGRPSESQAIATMHAAFDAGATLVDTADAYCMDQDDFNHNERLVARALREWPGVRGIIVATKGGVVRPGGRWERNGDPRYLRQACERSLAALGVERIDLYQLHAPDPDVPFAESVGALAELRAEGKIRWVGLSNVSVKLIEEARAIVEITCIQNRLSPFFREALVAGPGGDPTVVDYCARKGLGFLAYSPVGGGRLNRKLPSHPVLQTIGRIHGASPHAVTLAWVLSRGATVIPIPGARTVEHVQDAMTAADLVLTAEELEQIEKAEFSRA